MEGGKGLGSAEYPRSQVASPNFSIIIRIWDAHFPYTPTAFFLKVVLYLWASSEYPYIEISAFRRVEKKILWKNGDKNSRGLRIQLKVTEEKRIDL